MATAKGTVAMATLNISTSERLAREEVRHENAAERHKHGNDDLSHYADYVDDVAEELRKSLANASGNTSSQ